LIFVTVLTRQKNYMHFMNYVPMW